MGHLQFVEALLGIRVRTDQNPILHREQALPLGQIQELVDELSKSASASADIDTILRYQQALMRAKEAIANGDTIGRRKTSL